MSGTISISKALKTGRSRIAVPESDPVFILNLCLIRDSRIDGECKNIAVRRKHHDGKRCDLYYPESF